MGNKAAAQHAGNIQTALTSFLTGFMLFCVKKAVIVILAALLMFSAAGCKSTDPGKTAGKSPDGWADDNTYITAAIGVPVKKLTDIESRKKSAKRSAILNAQFQVIEGFKNTAYRPANYMEYNVTWIKEGMEKREKIYTAAKNGVIDKESYDGEQNCEIVYKVYDKDLKKKVIDALSWPK